MVSVGKNRDGPLGVDTRSENLEQGGGVVRYCVGNYVQLLFGHGDKLRKHPVAVPAEQAPVSTEVAAILTARSQ